MCPKAELHPRPDPLCPDSFDRLDRLWEKYKGRRERVPFTTLDLLLMEHESYRKDFDELREEYLEKGYERFLVQLSWSSPSWPSSGISTQTKRPAFSFLRVSSPSFSS